MGKKNKIPAKIKQYWCYGCLSFVIIDWQKGHYFCAKKCEDIHPSQEMSCKFRNIVPFTEDEEPEQSELPL